MKQYRALRGVRLASGYYATGQTIQATPDEAQYLLAARRIVELPEGVRFRVGDKELEEDDEEKDDEEEEEEDEAE